jgi:hypothetical protein
MSLFRWLTAIAAGLLHVSLVILAGSLIFLALMVFTVTMIAYRSVETATMSLYATLIPSRR